MHAVEPPGEVPSPGLVIGVGVSAGALDALHELLQALPARPGMSFLLSVQHLDPAHERMLVDTLARATRLRVCQAQHLAAVAPDTVYVMPPRMIAGIRDGLVEVREPDGHGGAHLPLDHLFRSMARTLGPGAVGLVLAGAGRDGTVGLRAIRAAGGLTIAQQPDGMSHPGMIRGAIDAGVVDLVLPVGEIPGALERFAGMPAPATSAPAPDALSEESLSRLAAILRSSSDFDVKHYKPATVSRRVRRRLGLRGFPGIEPYLTHLRGDPAEQQALVRDFLIGVTEFFRDPQAFEALRTLAVDEIVASARPEEAIRVWVPACATGEEAYSVAMLLLEAMEARGEELSLQVFATDMDEESLSAARNGVYPALIAGQVSEQRLARFFLPAGAAGFRVRPLLRDVVSFAVHDLCSDPPFSRMDLISCRNMLIYLRAQAQDFVLRSLHFALKPGGYLFLGSSENLGTHRSTFSVASKPWRIFRRAEPPAGEPEHGFGPRGSFGWVQPPGLRYRSAWTRVPMEPAPARPEAPRTADLARDAIFESRVPPTVVVSGEGRVIYTHGDLGPYLHYPKGEPRLDLLAALRDDLVIRVRAALYKCHRDQSSVTVLSSPDADGNPLTKITASIASSLGDGAVVLTFEPSEPAEPRARAPSEESEEQESIIEQLERELQATRDDLRSTVEELESSNDELRAANEESMSMNEELQSANEELEATTEELRSLNEELSSVNAQLKEKVEQLEQAHDDQSNFFASTKLATVFLDDTLRIKRFTPAAAQLLQLDDDDQGRAIDGMSRELLQGDLHDEARSVLAELAPRRRELKTEDGRWFVRGVLPYRTESRRIEGVVVTWLDVTDLKQTSERLAAREGQQAVIARLGLRALEGEDLEAFMEQVVREVQQTLGTDCCGLLERHPDAGLLLLKAGVGWKDGLVGSATVSATADHQAGYTLSVHEAVTVTDLAEEKRFSASPLATSHGIVSSLTCMVQDGETAYGVLGAYARSRRRFSDEDANFLQAVANVLASAISRKQARDRLAVKRGVASVLSESRSLDEAAPRIIEVFAQEIGIDIGELWLPAADGDALQCAAFETPDEPYRRAELRRCMDEARFHKGEGLVGRVWERAQGEWLTHLGDEDMFARAEQAQALGLRSGIGFPILIGREACGVMSLFARRRIVSSASFLHALESLGTEIGEFVRRTEAERATRSSMERLGLAVDAASAMVFESDLHDQVITSFHGVERIAGEHVPAPVPMQWWIDRIHPDDRPGQIDVLARMTRDQETFSVLEYRVRRRDGHYAFVEVHTRLFRSEADGRLRCIGVVLDVSERKRAEATLVDRERRLRLAVRALDAGVFEHAIPVGEELYLGERWCELLGYRPEELPPPARFSAWLLDSVIHPEDRVRHEEAYADLIEGRVDRCEIEVRMRHGHGYWIWGRVAVDAAERDRAGRGTRITGLLWDVTAAKEAEQRLRESEQSMRMLAESIPHMVWTAGPEGANDYYNTTALTYLGRTLEDMTRPGAWLEIIHPDDRATAAAMWRSSTRTGVEYRCDFRLRHAADGEFLWHDVHAVPIRNEHDRIVRWFGTCTNIHHRKVAEDLLRESEMRLQRTFEGSPLGIAFFRADGRITRCNDALRAMLGYQRGDGELDWLSLVPPEYAEQERAALEGLARAGRIGPNEMELLRKDGTRVTVLHSAVMIGVDDEHVAFFVDLTPQKQVEAELVKLAVIVESSDDAILSKDLDGIIQSWNPGAQRLYGYRAEEVIGKSVSVIMPPERTGELVPILTRLARGERIASYETVRLRKDGSRVDVSVTISPIEQGGRIVGACAVARDITERKRADALLRDSEDRYREQASELEAIYATLPVGLALYDREYRFLRINRKLAELNGLPVDAHLGQRADELVPNLPSMARAFIDQVFESGGAIQNVELSAENQRGRSRHWLCSYAPVNDAEGRIRAVSCVVQDITDRKRAEDALQEASRQKDQFLAMLGHELRNPLAAIRSASELLKLTHASDTRLQRTQSILDRQTAHMAKLLDGLLDVSRIVRGKITLELGTVDLADVLRDTLQDQTEQLERRGLALRTEGLADTLWIEGDRVRLTQIFDNLLSNALKFTDAPGTITIAALHEGDDVAVKVRDTGAGIEPDLLPHIFEPFRQAAQNLDRSAGGLGLGLALVSGLVELHGGRIEARSEGPGQGTEFTLRFPASPAPAERPAPKVAPPERQRLLVVEDHRDMADLLRDMLVRAGHDVTLAHDGEQALDAAREVAPDVILCDIGLPGGMNGYDVARAIRREDQLRNVFLVAVSGYGRPEDKQQAHMAGFDAHLTKPVSMEAIREILARARG